MLSPHEIDSIADALADRVAAKLATANRATDVYGIAEIIGCSVPTVERLVSDGAIPSFKVGRLRRFITDDVITALKSKGGCDHGE